MKTIISYISLFCGLLICGCQNKEPSEKKHSFFWGFALEGHPILVSQLHHLQQKLLQPQMVNFYLQWPMPGEKGESFIPSLEAIWHAGAVPCLTWEPMYTLNSNIKAISYEEIVNHKYDGYLLETALALKAWGKPVIIRFAHEMNLRQYHWGSDEPSYGPKSPEIYVKLFHYIVDFFRAHDVNNILWVFCPNADSIPNEKWNNIAAYYPGDNYVDILGMDGYNWEPEDKSSRSFGSIFTSVHHELRTISQSKPIIVFETATTSHQKEWIQEALETSQQWGLWGIIWFEVHKERNWQLQDDQKTLNLIKQATSSTQTWVMGLIEK